MVAIRMWGVGFTVMHRPEDVEQDMGVYHTSVVMKNSSIANYAGPHMA